MPPVLYLAVDIIIMVVLSNLLGTNFWKYGNAWLSYDEYEKRNLHGAAMYPLVPDDVFPRFGMCSLYSKHAARRVVSNNLVVAICEVSSHVLYQYSFVFIWLAMIFGFTSCVVQIIYNIVSACILYCAKRRYRLSMMQCELLDIVRSTDLVMYRRLKMYMNR